MDAMSCKVSIDLLPDTDLLAGHAKLYWRLGDRTGGPEAKQFCRAAAADKLDLPKARMLDRPYEREEVSTTAKKRSETTS
mmetsp:Transcript_38148/g.120162  ORF Transcript_38148/g.120162 Transcript_38148/m.120162 type:complete len:80 (+) Transcript_38148:919-1158(+)